MEDLHEPVVFFGSYLVSLSRRGIGVREQESWSSREVSRSKKKRKAADLLDFANCARRGEAAFQEVVSDMLGGAQRRMGMSTRREKRHVSGR